MVLKDRLHISAKAPPLRRLQPDKVLAFVENRTRGRLRQTQQQTGERCLAAAALADDRGDRRGVGVDRQGEIRQRNGRRAFQKAAPNVLLTSRASSRMGMAG